MTSLILPSRLTRQPQQAVQANVTDLGRRLAVSVVPSLARSVVLNQPLTLASGVSRVATPYGIALQHAATNGSVNFGATGGASSLVGGAGRQLGVFIRMRVTALSTRQIFFADFDSSGAFESFNAEITAGNQWRLSARDSVDSVKDAISSVTVSLGLHDVLAVHVPGSGNFLYVDGVLVASVAFATNLASGTLVRLGGPGAYLGGVGFLGQISVCHIFKGDVTSQLQSLRDNPNQVFTAPARQMLVASAAPAGGGITMPAAQGSYTITGNDAGLRVARRLTANPGAYTLTGNAATLRTARRLGAAPGAYAITGNAANLIKGTAPKSLPGDSGSYVITGRPAALRVARRIVAAPGSYAITGFSTGAAISGAMPRYAETTFMRLSVVRCTTNLGPDRIQRTLGFP
jgi:hypothetical protein